MSINIQLDLFVVASSIMSVVGMPGHASYGASNSFVDAFMEWRRGKGLPGQSINWGALEVGMASRSREKLQSMGHNFLSVKEIRSCFIDALMQNSNCVIYAAINWELAGKGVIQNPKLRSQYKTFLSEVAPTLEEHDLEFKRLDIDALKSASPSEHREIIGELVLKVAGGLIFGERSEVLPNETFVNQGFDSISRLQFVNILRRETDGQYIQGEDLLDKTDTVNKVIDYLVHEMFEEEGRTCADTVETTVTFAKHDNI
ncbi:hypothetical protein DPMN_068014 [Dreissena polymorpha]|uniref:Carrier domain-containing protein n=1 Tax=Dreissena polymorpha TaxID=45954 RepID=A0A9D4BT89_DREPO|nr:hypothetical protein DPMN_068014 [Dreissena polymorpha]